MVSRVQLSATTSRPLVLRQDPDADLSRYTTTGKGKTHGGMTTGDSHMGFKTASTVCPIKSQLIQYTKLALMRIDLAQLAPLAGSNSPRLCEARLQTPVVRMCGSTDPSNHPGDPRNVRQFAPVITRVTAFAFGSMVATVVRPHSDTEQFLSGF